MLCIETTADRLTDSFITFTKRCKDKRRSWSVQIAVIDEEKSEHPIVRVDFQVDKTFKNRITVQEFEVDPQFRRQGLGRQVVRSLKRAAVAVGRVAHFQTVLSTYMLDLLDSEDFFPADGGHCFVWEPLSLTSWTVNASQFQVEEDRSAREFQGHVSQLVDVWSTSIPGMEIFKEHARWFKPETDLKKISEELSVPIEVLEPFRVDRGCFHSSSTFAYISSFFPERKSKAYVIEGLAIDKFGIPLEHACLCTINEGRMYCFDLVRRDPLFMYGVVVRKDMKKKMNHTCSETWAGYSVINGLNYVKHNEEFWKTP